MIFSNYSDIVRNIGPSPDSNFSTIALIIFSATLEIIQINRMEFYICWI